MACKRLKVTQIRAKNAENTDSVLFRGVINPSITAYLSSGDKRHEKQHSHVHRNGGTSPRWDHTFSFTVVEAAARDGLLTLKFQIKAEKTDPSHQEVVIGSVKVPVKKLLDQPGGDGMPEVATYDVWSPSGKVKGVLKFRYQFGDLEAPPADGAARRAPRAPPAARRAPPAADGAARRALRAPPATAEGAARREPAAPDGAARRAPAPARRAPSAADGAARRALRALPATADGAARRAPAAADGAARRAPAAADARVAPYSPPQGFPPQFYYPAQGYAPHPQGYGLPPQVYLPAQGYAPPALQPQQLPPWAYALQMISAWCNVVDTVQGVLEGFGFGAALNM